jgi:hypothetical protein
VGELETHRQHEKLWLFGYFSEGLHPSFGELVVAEVLFLADFVGHGGAVHKVVFFALVAVPIVLPLVIVPNVFVRSIPVKYFTDSRGVVVRPVI